MSIREELILAARAANGSHKTVANRVAIVHRFADFLQQSNIQVRQISHLKTTHLERYIQHGLERGLSARTLQTEASALRTTLTAAGREKLASNLDNKKLGISNASRIGTKTAMPDSKLQEIRAAVAEKDLGVLACIDLQRSLGLREKEGIMGALSLKTWLNNLEQGKPICVLSGTKGGRAREVRPADPIRAIQAVRSAMDIMKTQGGRIIDKPNLKSALARYSRVMNRCGATGQHAGHSLRYAFAREQFQHYKSQGFSERESRSLVALDLGHGSGRGRWVEQVYLK